MKVHWPVGLRFYGQINKNYGKIKEGENMKELLV
jgi:hypothetical protein